MKKTLVTLLGAGLLLLTTAATPATARQSRHGAPGVERKSTARRLGQESANKSWMSPVRTASEATQRGFSVKASSLNLPRKAAAPAAAGLNLPAFQGNVTYSDAWTPTTYPTLGVYTLPTTAENTFELLIDGPNGNRGGVVKNGIYFCHTYENFMGMFDYYDIFGYSLETGTKVFEFNGPNVGFMTQGLAVDPTDGTVYGLFYREDGSGMRLATVDYKMEENDVVITPVADIEGRWNALACTSKGQLYGIQVDQDATTNEVKSSSLCKIDKATAAVTTVGTTGQLPFYFTGATIDTKTDRMFWTVAPANQTGLLCEVNLSTGKADIVYTFPSNEEVTALWVPAPIAEDGAPAAATSLTAAFDGGSLTGTVEFTAPTTTFDGTAASGELSYTVSLNGAVAAQGTTAYGAKTSAAVTAPAAAEYEISVITSNAVGQSPAAKTTVFIGKGIPSTPAPTLTYTDGTMTLTWPAVETSANGGYIDPAAVTYTITRQPDSVVVADKLSGTTFSEKFAAPAELTQVSYTVVANYDTFSSEPAQSNSIVLGSLALPYSQDFSAESSLDAYTIIDGNNDGLLWGIQDGAAYLRFNMTYQLDDWMITPPVELKAGQCYRLSFDAYAQNAWSAERIEVKYGTGNSAADMTEALMVPTDLTSAVPTRFQFDIKPAADGRYFIGFHGISDPDTYGIFVDNINVAEGFATEGPATVAALKAVPDPDGEAKIEISFTTPRRTFSGKTLQSLTEVKILSGDEELTSFAAPATGTRLTYTDTREGKGPRSYTVVCYSEAGPGAPATVNSYCGIDIPGMTKEVTFVENATDGEVTLSWQPIAADRNGNVINPAKISYNLYSVEGGALVPVAQNITATTYTTRAVEAGAQRFAQYAVTGVSDAGEGEPNGSDMRPVGTPYELIAESFAGKQLGNYIWGMQHLSGQPSFGLLGDETGVPASDLDNGYFAFQASGNTAESGALMTGKVLIPANGSKGISLYAFCNGSDDINTIEVLVAEPNGQFKSLGAKAVNSTTGTTGWHKFHWDLSDYAGKTVNMQIVGAIKAYSPFALDRIRIGQLFDEDYAIIGFSCPEKVAPGNEYTCDVTVLNDGLRSGNSLIALNVNDKQACEAATSELAAGQAQTLSLKWAVSAIEQNDVTLSAAVLSETDENKDNNTTATATAKLRMSNLPGVTDLSAEATENYGAHLSWSQPDMTAILPEAIEESFESGESFAQEFEGWTFVDLDQKAVGGSYAFTIPGIVTGSTPASFVVFDTTDPMYNLSAHSGKKMLTSFFIYEGGQTDDWAISPALSGKAQTISFYARSYMSFAPETIEVYYSTGSTEPADFVLASNAIVVPEAWTPYSVELPAGAKHFAVRSCATDGYFLFLDDFEFEAEPTVKDLTLKGYEVFVNGTSENNTLVSACEFDYTMPAENVSENGSAAEFIVVTHYDKGISLPSNVATVNLTPTGVASIDSNLTISRQGRTVVIEGAEGMSVSVHSVDGKAFFTGTGKARTTIELAAGVYIVRAGNKTVKLILQ